MIVFLLAVYIVILAIFVWLKIVPFNLFWKLSPILVLAVLLIGLFIPMGWGAPSGPALVMRHSVQIVPNVAGEVIDVPVEANTLLKAGDILFRIDPAPYDAQVRAIDAQLKFAELRLQQYTQLQSRETGRAFDVQQRQAEVDQLRAQLDSAKWDLDKTTVRAPTDGYVTNLTLHKGARVTTQTPVMAFIDISETLFVAEIPQIYARYIQQGQPVEVTFKAIPGQVFTGQVETVLQAVSTGQAPATGLAATPIEVKSAPFIVRIKLDDATVASRLPAGSTGVAAIFTNHVKPSHMIRKVILRQKAILNYVNPF